MTGAEHDEFEVSYDVGPDVTAPTWQETGFVASAVVRPVVHLDAQYFDTADSALARQRTAVRRRTGGADAGWHVKRAEADRRREEHWSADGDSDEVPAAVCEAVAETTQGAPLIPVARIVNDRVVTDLYGSDGERLAEFCDDHVRGIRLSDGRETVWREWEVELDERASSWRPEERANFFARVERSLVGDGVVPAATESKLARVLLA